MPTGLDWDTVNNLEALQRLPGFSWAVLPVRGVQNRIPVRLTDVTRPRLGPQVSDDAVAVERSTAGGVFISYASSDESLASELRDALVKRGAKVFLASRDIAGGSLWANDIRDAIMAADEMLVLITPNSKDRPWGD